MTKIHKANEDNQYKYLCKELEVDCKKCSGLCCVALYFAKSEGFPTNKDVGKPCQNLMPDFKCKIHHNLVSKKMKGCLAYDCFGAGQKVTQIIYGGENWRNNIQLANQMFSVFLTVFQLHQMLWYLTEASAIVCAASLNDEINELISENEEITNLTPNEILAYNMEKYKSKVSSILKKTGEAVSETINCNDISDKKFDLIGKNFKKSNLAGKDLSMTLLIAANLEDCNLCGANFLGADLRDANIKNTDLSESIFITQGQINSAIGNANTKLPARIVRPIAW